MPINWMCKIGEGVRIPKPELVNLYDCTIGDGTKIGAFVEIQRGVVIGKRCKIQSHSFIPSGVIIDDDCFVGPGVIFTNDKYPRAVKEGEMVTWNWDILPTAVRRGASIGAKAVILPGLSIGEDAMVAAGAVVTKSVQDCTLVAGNPARFVRTVIPWERGC